MDKDYEARAEPEGLEKVEQERLRAFAQLRSETLKGVRESLISRVSSNPHLSEQEIQMGIFSEALEPQVRGAVFEMYKKGYESLSSGFNPSDQSEQYIEGGFELPNDVRLKLSSLGANLEEHTITSNLPLRATRISFRAQEPDLDKIKSKWDEIVESLPDLHKQTRGMSWVAVVTRYEFAKEEGERDLAQIEQWLNSGKYPETQVQRIRDQISKITSGHLKTPFRNL